MAKKRSKSRIQIGGVVTVKGKKYRITSGKIDGKKYSAVPVNKQGSTVHFGQSGAFAKPGTSKGDSYCARSYGIKSSKTGATPNDFARMLWNCQGKKSKNF